MISIRSLFRRVVVAAALATAPLSAAFAVPVFSFAPTGAHQAGSIFSVDVRATDLVDLYAWQLSIRFDPSLFRVLSVGEGGFLKAGGATFFDGGAIDNATGQVGFVFDTLISAVPGVSGSGVLATLNLQALNTAGASVFSFGDVLAITSAFGDIAVTATPITLVVPEPATVTLLFVAAGAALSLRRRRAGAACDRSTIAASFG